MLDNSEIRDEVRIAMRRAHLLAEDAGMAGFGVVTLWRPEEGILTQTLFSNLITTAGDEYNAKRIIQGINSYSYAPTITGMKLGTGTTTPTKSGSAAALGAYITGSNVSAWDTSYPTATAVGSDVGWYATYQCTWAAGVATNGAITEAILALDASTNATSTAANTVARVTFTAQPKGTGDTLSITWSHKFNGTT